MKVGLRVEDGWGNVDLHKVRMLLEGSFGKSLTPGYFFSPAKAVILDDEYMGMAVMKAVAGTPYLDKLAVSPDAKGSGLGKQLLDAVVAQYPEVIWRAKDTNPVNGWYLRNADGSHTENGWTVFWKGMSDAKGMSLVKDVLALPESFEKVAPAAELMMG